MDFGKSAIMANNGISKVCMLNSGESNVSLFTFAVTITFGSVVFSLVWQMCLASNCVSFLPAKQANRNVIQFIEFFLICCCCCFQMHRIKSGRPNSGTTLDLSTQQ